jgi:hypothetical protein
MKTQGENERSTELAMKTQGEIEAAICEGPESVNFNGVFSG